MRRGGLISRNIPLLITLLGLSVILHICHKPQQGYLEYQAEHPPASYEKWGYDKPIKIDTSKKGSYQDPNDPDFADPTDLQAEDEGQYEDKHQDFNPTQK